MSELTLNTLHYSKPHPETKLCIVVDSSTPIVMKVPISPESLTLGQFKHIASLQDNCYKFYFKSEDSEFGVVKEEVIDDSSTLPHDGDKIVAWVITSDTNQSSLFEQENSVAKTRLDLSHNRPASACQSSIYSNPDRPIYYNVVHKDPQVQTHQFSVHLLLDSQNFLGITLVGSGDDIENGIYVGGISPGSVAEKNGRIEIGDRVVDINGTDLRGLMNDDAVALFKCCVDRRGIINLTLERNQQRNITDHTLNTGDYAIIHNHQPTTELTESLPSYEDLPIPEFGNEGAISRQSEKKVFGDSHSLPRSITPRSLYTSTTFGNLPTGGSLRLQMDTRSAYEPTTPTSIRHFNTTLHYTKDDVHTIYAALAADAKSLDIKDREWLKVTVKDAFLGSFLVKWLSRNVYGFCNKRETKQYANRMLTLGLIRSPIASAKFSEKCYYTLS